MTSRGHFNRPTIRWKSGPRCTKVKGMLRVATFNLHACVGDDGVLDLERTARDIAGTGASFIALQELDRGLARSRGVDQPLEIARLTGHEVCFFPTIRRGRGEYGFAVAATQGISDAVFVELPRLGDEEPRGAAVVTWRQITLIATHLAWQRRVAALQVQALAELTSTATLPVVVLGDLNLRRASLAPLLRLGFRAGRRVGTYKSLGVRRQIDYILAGPGLQLGGPRAQESRASDHLPLVAEIAPSS